MLPQIRDLCLHWCRLRRKIRIVPAASTQRVCILCGPIGRGSPGHGGPEWCAFGIETPSGLRIAFGECDALGELLIMALAPFLGSWLS